MSDAVVEMPGAESDAEVAPFAAAAAEGPFGFKPDRNRPIEPHFDGFGRLTPEQARAVLDVRDGRVPRCVLRLAGESVLVEHAGQGYTDPATGVAWGYRVRRVGHDGPPVPPPAEVAEVAEVVRPEVTPVVAVEGPAPAVVPPAPIRPPPPVVRRPVPRVVPVPPEADPDAADGAEWDDHWTAPARSSRAAALADPAERAALVRVLILWVVVGLLVAECVAVLAVNR